MHKAGLQRAGLGQARSAEHRRAEQRGVQVLAQIGHQPPIQDVFGPVELTRAVQRPAAAIAEAQQPRRGGEVAGTGARNGERLNRPVLRAAP